MAVRADRPWLGSGETAALDALVHTPDDRPAPVTFRWSWCPLPVEDGAQIGCAIDQASFEALVVEATGAPWTVPAYGLGAGAEARLAYPLPEGSVTEVCEALFGLGLATLLEAPDCAEGMEVAVMLVAEHDGVSIETVKRVAVPVVSRSA